MIGIEQKHVLSKWRFILIATFVLMSVTVATPLATQSGEIIVSTSKMQALKLAARSFSAALLLVTAILLTYRKNGAPFLLRFGPLIAFGLWALASCTWSAVPKESISQGGSFGILILLAFVVSFCWDHQRDSEHVLKTLAYMLLFISCVLIFLRVCRTEVRRFDS